MLVQVGRAVKRDKGVVFLGWTPHPMNVQYDIKYLKGGEAYFGESGTVNTLVRKGYAAQCPNVGKLLSNLKFTQEMENAIMDEVLARIDELPKDRKLLFICAAGVRSGLACEMAAAMGLEADVLFNIEDGTPAWIEKSHPTSYGMDS